MSDTYTPDPKPEETYDEVPADYEDHAAMPGYQELMGFFDKYFSHPEDYPEGISAEILEEELGADYDYNYETAQTALEDYFNQYGVPEEQRQPIYDAMEAHEGGYGPEALAEGLTINYTEVNNYVDQSQNIHAGDYAEIYATNENEANVATASAEGAVAAGDDIGGDVQSQTGDGVQAGQADNIQTGSDNVAGSDYATRVGDEQVSADYGQISESEFGEGDNNADDLYDSQNKLDADIDVKDSFNYDETTTDDDHVKVDVDVDTPGYEHEAPVYEEPEYHEPEAEYEADYKPEEPHYEEPEAEYGHDDDVYDG
jgi:hypothetical protein